MAIINCPVCGKSVSDKGKDCIHCGSLLSVQNGQNSLNDEVTCPECGADVPKNSERCEICGCPLHDDGAEKGKKKGTKKAKKEKVKKEKVKKEKVKKEKVKKEKIKKEKKPKKVLSPKEKLEKEKRVFKICSIVSLVMSELSLATAIVLPLFAIIGSFNHNTMSFNHFYFEHLCVGDVTNIYYDCFWYTDESMVILYLIISFVCRFGFVAARKIFKEKTLKAERELDKYVDEEK